VVICRDPNALQNALSVSGDYLPNSDQPDPYFYTPEMSRRARSIETWAALQSLGRTGLIDLIETSCAHARRFAANLTEAGFSVLNEVDLNQVLVSFGDSKITDSIIKKIQEEGTCWCGGTIWKGQAAMRISVSSWMTTEEDVAKSSEAIIRIANQLLQRK
jgi:glutamate/tyrosine decarboxylase-like PLP-dependent enzyme